MVRRPSSRCLYRGHFMPKTFAANGLHNNIKVSADKTMVSRENMHTKYKS